MFGKVIKYYDELFVPEEEYRKTIEETDILINAINVDFYKLGIFHFTPPPEY